MSTDENIADFVLKMVDFFVENRKEQSTEWKRLCHNLNKSAM